MKTIVDSSVWIDYFRGGAEELDVLLSQKNVLTHSAVIGELSCGNIPKRNEFLGNIKTMPKVKEASVDEILNLIEDKKLYGKGLSITDVQILASALLSDAGVLTRDRAMLSAIKSLGLNS